jgi:hypothetical protein
MNREWATTMKKVPVWFLLGSLALAAPAWAQDDTDSAVFRTGLGVTSLKFTDRNGNASTHRFGIVDFGASKSFGGVFVGFDTELPFNQGGSAGSPAPTATDQNATTDELVQMEDADLTLGYGFKNQLSVFTGWHYARYDFWRNGTLFSRQTDRGPFLGLGYGFSVGKSGQLSASLAYGDFNSDTGAGPGKSTGTSVGLTWTSDFRHGLSWYARLKWLDYKFKLDSDVVVTGGRDATKSIVSLAIGLVY